MKSIRQVISIFALAVILYPLGVAHAQNYDFEHYPPMNARYKHLDLKLQLDTEQMLVKGEAVYTMQANLDSTRQLLMNAAHIDVQSVKVNGGKASYTAVNDSLQVTLPEGIDRGNDFSLDIVYQASPNFGLLKDAAGSVWASRLPRSNAHWLPVLDHPRAAFTTSVQLTVPAGYSAVSNGRFEGSKAATVDTRELTWTSDKPVAASDVAFAAGKFDHVSASFGVKKINLYTESGLVDEAQRDSLLRTAYRALTSAEQKLHFEYPYDAFNLVVLADHFWEQKPYAASLGFVYVNRGNLAEQVKRSVYAQWFGTYQREEQWLDAQAMPMYQTWLQFALNEHTQKALPVEDQPDQDEYTLYEVFGPERWNEWQQFYPNWKNTRLKATLSRSASDLLQEGRHVYDWNDYAQFWYARTGQPWFSVPEVTTEEPADSIRYRVDYRYDEINSKVKLVFTARDSFYNELVTLPFVEQLRDGTAQKEVTFTGRTDSVVVNVNRGIRDAHLETGDRPLLVLDQHRPVPFLLHEIREAADASRRRAAALQLGEHTENPDLQLALLDVMKKEQDPGVKAALYRTMGRLMDGATGTESTFTEALRSKDEQVRLAALDALRHYKNHPDISSRVNRMAMKTDDASVAREAVRIYAELVSKEDYLTFAKKLAASDSTGFRSLEAMHQLARKDAVTEAVKLGDRFLGESFVYPVRSGTLRFLLENDASRSRWMKRLPDLLSDIDPRIRYLAVEGVKNLAKPEAKSMLQEHLMDEYDVRVLSHMKSYLPD